MAKLSSFSGVDIYMYPYDNKQHHVPHIHAEYGEHKISISISEHHVIDEGSMPKRKLKLIKE